MKGYVRQDRHWLVFWTQPMCFHVLKRIPQGISPSKQEMRAFRKEQIEKIEEYLANGGTMEAAW